MAIAASVRIEHGTTAIPSVEKEPNEIAAAEILRLVDDVGEPYELVDPDVELELDRAPRARARPPGGSPPSRGRAARAAPSSPSWGALEPETPTTSRGRGSVTAHVCPGPSRRSRAGAGASQHGRRRRRLAMVGAVGGLAGGVDPQLGDRPAELERLGAVGGAAGTISRSRSGRAKAVRAHSTSAWSQGSTSASTTVTVRIRLTLAHTANMARLAAPGRAPGSSDDHGGQPSGAAFGHGHLAHRGHHPAQLRGQAGGDRGAAEQQMLGVAARLDRLDRRRRGASSADRRWRPSPRRSPRTCRGTRTRDPRHPLAGSSRPSSTISQWAGTASPAPVSATSTGSPSSPPAYSSSSAPRSRYRHAASSTAGWLPIVTAIGSVSPRAAASREHREMVVGGDPGQRSAAAEWLQARDRQVGGAVGASGDDRPGGHVGAGLVLEEPRDRQLARSRSSPATSTSRHGASATATGDSGRASASSIRSWIAPTSTPSARAIRARLPRTPPTTAIRDPSTRSNRSAGPVSAAASHADSS